MRINLASKANRRNTMKHLTGTVLGLALLLIATALPASAADIVVTMKKATQDGTGDSIGTITITSSDLGATFQFDLHGLPPGSHGFHVHENASCGPTLMGGIRIPAGAAGDHFDPENTGKHAGPMGDGHLGDLPAIEVGAGGTAKQALTAPRIKDIEALRKHALIIQVGGDNYSDSPARDGGGGGRFACGLIE
jgi:superoxide dismutase, Cu-Zn family